MSYEERRVLVKTYGTLPRSSPLLVTVAGTCGPMRLHTLAAEGFGALARAAKGDLKIELKIASGWRPHRWRSRKHYEETVIERYGSLAEGRRFLAYSSPHETGLAMDLGVGGLKPDRRTIDEQRKSKLHRWMVEEAFKFGWHPYKVEPWHWEFPISVQAWKTGIHDDDEVVLLDDDEGAEEDELWGEDDG
ncbi:MAG: D-alanyl-D-alanine carboxypeptidase family protein [Nannocystis sp.]|nr:D-alanyl-D-alanine carboxypeptidase family protein [Nannocystis sp.]